jgi:hypothetical protein
MPTFRDVMKNDRNLSAMATAETAPRMIQPDNRGNDLARIFPRGGKKVEW